MLKLKPSGFFFLASFIVMAHGSAWAQQEPIPMLPEIQVDGSVLQRLTTPIASETPSQNLAPVKLIPPSFNRTAVPATGSLTMFESDALSPPVEAEHIKPIITVTEAPKIKAPKPVAKTAEALVKTPIPLRKPQIAAKDKPVVFPIKAKTKTVGELNPGTPKTATAPVQPGGPTSAALSLSMAQRDLPTEQKSTAKETASWRQANPEVLYDNIPVPKPRPDIGMATASFVQKARENLVDTYTIVKREGDKMPAIPKQKVAGEKLPAPRLSIADIAGDPLASRIANMTPEEVAQALNKMTPASGREGMHLSRELSTVAKPRIVREMGEWVRKDAKVNQQDDEYSQINKTTVNIREGEAPATANSNFPLPPKTPAVRISKDKPEKKIITEPATLELASLPAQQSPTGGTISVNFAAGEASLTKEATGAIDKSVVETMKNSPASRIQIVAYAAALDGKEGTARRTSLSRALSVRSYLISQGIDATRMDVRAMGIQTDKKTAADKVDMVLVLDKES